MLVYRETYKKIRYRLTKAMLVYRDTCRKIRYRFTKVKDPLLEVAVPPTDAAAPKGFQLVVRNNHTAQGKHDVKTA